MTEFAMIAFRRTESVTAVTNAAVILSNARMHYLPAGLNAKYAHWPEGRDYPLARRQYLPAGLWEKDAPRPGGKICLKATGVQKTPVRVNAKTAHLQSAEFAHVSINYLINYLLILN
jgi:hypothetical protein